MDIKKTHQPITIPVHNNNRDITESTQEFSPSYRSDNLKKI